MDVQVFLLLVMDYLLENWNVLIVDIVQLWVYKHL